MLQTGSYEGQPGTASGISLLLLGSWMNQKRESNPSPPHSVLRGTGPGYSELQGLSLLRKPPGIVSFISVFFHVSPSRVLTLLWMLSP